MKVAFIRSALFVTAVISLAACQNNFDVKSQVEQSVHDNKTAASLVEWESSPAHPEVLFENWNKAVKDGSISAEDANKKVCGELSQLGALELTIFEHEISKPENASLVAGCKEELKKKLDDYYLAQRKKMPVTVDKKNWSAGFKFPNNVQKRDTSKGYYGWSGDVGKKEIVLTFDDGPSAEYTESILATLKEVNAKAVFFNQGKNVLNNKEIVKKVAVGGHSIGSHSVTHSCLAANAACLHKNGHQLTYDQAVAEIRGSHQAVYDSIGWVDPFFRFPYGESDAELKNFLKTNRVGEFNWNMDSEDWRATSNEELFNTAMSEVTRAGRGIILFHDIQRRTAETLPQILKELYTRGYSIVLLQPADLNSRYNSPLVQKPNKP